MPSSSTHEDIDLFIESVLFQGHSIRPEGDKETCSSTSEVSLHSSIPEPLTYMPHDGNEEQKIIQDHNLSKFQDKSASSKNTRPKDYLKNMYNNSLKFIVKRYISKTYQRKVQKIHRKIGITDSEEAKSYYRIRQQQTIGLTNLCDLLNFNSGSSTERQYKQAFHTFYVWFMKYRYPTHILQTSKLQHADVYWKAKNILIYLPQIKPKVNDIQFSKSHSEKSIERSQQ